MKLCVRATLHDFHQHQWQSGSSILFILLLLVNNNMNLINTLVVELAVIAMPIAADSGAARETIKVTNINAKAAIEFRVQ